MPRKMSNMEEFSFPVVSNNNNPLSSFMLSSSCASSSSLWRISSRVYHHQEDYEDKQEQQSHFYDDHHQDHHMEVRSMCEEILPSIYRMREFESFGCSFTSKELEVEERMDYLWEDFNEEEQEEVVKVRKSIDGEVCGVMKVTNKFMGRRHSSDGNNNSKMLMFGKLLKGLISIRKSAQNRFLKSRF